MGTMNFSIPDDVKDAFNAVFANENKSAVVAELMRKAIEAKSKKESRDVKLDALIDELLRQRAADVAVSDDEISAARHEGRP